MAKATAIAEAVLGQVRVRRDVAGRVRIALEVDPADLDGKVVDEGLVDQDGARLAEAPGDGGQKRRGRGGRWADRTTTTGADQGTDREEAPGQDDRSGHASSRRMTGKRGSSTARMKPAASQNAGVAPLVASGRVPISG